MHRSTGSTPIISLVTHNLTTDYYSLNSRLIYPQEVKSSITHILKLLYKGLTMWKPNGITFSYLFSQEQSHSMNNFVVHPTGFETIFLLSESNPNVLWGSRSLFFAYSLLYIYIVSLSLSHSLSSLSLSHTHTLSIYLSFFLSFFLSLSLCLSLYLSLSVSLSLILLLVQLDEILVLIQAGVSSVPLVTVEYPYDHVQFYQIL